MWGPHWLRNRAISPVVSSHALVGSRRSQFVSLTGASWAILLFFVMSSTDNLDSSSNHCLHRSIVYNECSHSVYICKTCPTYLNLFRLVSLLNSEPWYPVAIVLQRYKIFQLHCASYTETAMFKHRKPSRIICFQRPSLSCVTGPPLSLGYIHNFLSIIGCHADSSLSSLSFSVKRRGRPHWPLHFPQIYVFLSRVNMQTEQEVNKHRLESTKMLL